MRGVTMTGFKWVKRKSVAAVVVCVILAVASIAFWQMNQGAQAAMVYPHPGLVGWWRFDEGSGTVAGDSSGNGNDGTVYGTTWVDGKYGKALSFDGIDDYVNIPASASLQSFDEFSISFWMYPTAGGDGYYRHIFDKGWNIPSSFVVFIEPTATAPYSLYFYIMDSTGGKAAAKSFPSLNDWYHVVATFKRNDKVRLYINAVGVEGASTLDEALSLDSWIRLAQDTNDFQGVLDEVRIYNRALSAAEVQADFQKSPDFSSKLLAKVPKGATQVITTLSWQGVGSINVTIQSPSENYTEDIVPVYQKTVYSTTDGISSMLNIKRLSITVTALSSDENWYVMLEFGNVEDYRITVEVQK